MQLYINEIVKGFKALNLKRCENTIIFISAQKIRLLFYMLFMKYFCS